MKTKKQLHTTLVSFFTVLFTLHFLVSGIFFAVAEEGGEAPPPPPQETSEPAFVPDTVISTGDSVASGNVETNTNVNDVSTADTSNTEGSHLPEENTDIVEGVTEEPTPNTENAEEVNGETQSTEPLAQNTEGTPLIEDSTALSQNENTEEMPLSEESNEAEEQPIDLNVENENEALIENEVSINANSGGNSGDGRSVVIETGNAIAEAKLINMANVNIVNAEGLFTFLSNLFGEIFDLDLRSFNFFSEEESDTSSCTPSVCGGNGDLSVSNENTASIENVVTVRANTGENTATGSEESIIETGNAYAAANVINVANTNIVDSNYLFLVFNNFGDWEGDLVFPGRELFLDLFGEKETNENNNENSTSLTINNENLGIIENNISTSGNTGNNSLEGEEGVIVTGDSGANTGVSNVLNTNTFENESFMVMLRVHGDWSGEVYGIPDGMNWSRIGDMVYLYSDELGGTFSQNGFNEESNNGFSNQTTISNENNAVIKNNVDVFAMTGGNTGRNNSAISTGNAYATANIMNISNTNIIGRNVLFALLNVFGNWNGNITFGRPDLWIGGRAYSSSPNPQVGNEIVYSFTVENNGDLESTNTSISGYLHEGLTIGASSHEYTIDKNRILKFNIGSIFPGEHKTLILTTVLNGNALPSGKTTIIPMEFTVKGTEKDENSIDNIEYVSFAVGRNPERGGFGGPQPTPSPKLTVQKSSLAESVVAGKASDYKIIITNEGGGEAYSSILIDTLKDKNGIIINQETWDLGTILPGEEIIVDYSVLFATSTKEGFYTNFAEIRALGGFPDFSSGYIAKANSASAKIFVEGTVSPPLLLEQNTSTSEEAIEDIEEGDELVASENSQQENTPFLGIKNIKLPISPFENFDSIKIDAGKTQTALALNAQSTKKTLPKSTFYTVALFAGLMGALRGRGGKWMLL